MVIEPYLMVENIHYAVRVGFVYQDTYSIGFLRFYDCAIYLSVFLIRKVVAAVLEVLLEKGPISGF